MLIPHPDSLAGGFSVDTKLSRFGPDVLECEFAVIGPLAEIALPDLVGHEREDCLWKTTCFELFLAPRQSAAYREWNFSPTGRWAAYEFAAYRDGMAPLLDSKVDIRAERSEDVRYRLNAHICCRDLSDLLDGRVGFSAILEHHDGSKSFWALNHPPGPPDFHHSDCFGAELAAPGQA